MADIFLESMQARIPHEVFNVYDSKILSNILSIFAQRYSDRMSYIDRLDAMIGINTTYDDDLEYRWGSLLNIYRLNGETSSEYRVRLRIAYSSLGGGTADTIRYVVASSIGVNNQDTIDKYIKIFDGWKYLVNDEPIAGMTYGHFICEINLLVQGGVADMEDTIMSAINRSKASGTTPHIVFVGGGTQRYNDIGILSYSSLTGMKYSDLG